ncbi:MAG TPA: response regulator [Candidatus Dormibacteraeota bacterium]|nr:response regulator [Candidatus Dormibacteraeota bacterium]
MAKILVADDNSNIQRMVGLALKDQGIEVTAVGNGEAAVRKISEIHPDLVLADVFMPVRNGYEVCQYVKEDPTLKHIPVILLVGAFDPLDEQEAQRVGADGVLKKPFVPPDPLIAMVKSSLARAGVPPFGASRAKTSKRPAVAPPTFAESTDEPEEDESFAEDIPKRPEPMKIDSGKQPLAFGSLLGTETEEEEIYTPPVTVPVTNPQWLEPASVQEEKETEPVPWRPDTTIANSLQDWNASAVEEVEVGSAKPEVAQPAIPSSGDRRAAGNATSPVEKSWTAQHPEAVPTGPAVHAESATRETVTAAGEETGFVPTKVTTTSGSAEEETATKSKGKSWFSSLPNPWDAGLRKVKQLTSTWDSAPTTDESLTLVDHQMSAPAGEQSAVKAEPVAQKPAAIEGNKYVPVEPTPLAASSMNEETSNQPVAERTPEQGAVSASAESSSAADAANMDELVAKVLSKMSPDMLQAVTREILKPVVAAMLKDELKPKE